MKRVVKPKRETLIACCGGKQKIKGFFTIHPFSKAFFFSAFFQFSLHCRQRKKWDPKFFRNGHPSLAPWESTRLEEALF